MPEMSIPQRLEMAHQGTNPSIVCRVPSGWVAMCDMQYLRGYCILLADPAVESINALDESGRARFMLDMSLVGDALLKVTGAYRINYAMLSNTDPYLHAHIVPRYLEEPEEFRRQLPWSYPPEHRQTNSFDPGRDRDLMRELAAAIQTLLQPH